MKNQIGFMITVCCLFGCNSSGINFLGGKKQKQDALRADAAIAQSETVFAGKLTAAEKSQVRNASIEEVYESLLNKASDKTIVVYGVKLSGIKSLMIEMQPAFDFVAKRYGTFGEMLDDRGADLDHQPSPAEARIILEEAANLADGRGNWSEIKDIIAKGQLDLGMEPEISYEDMELTQRAYLAKPEEFVGPTVCGTLKAAGTFENDLVAAAACVGTIFVASVKDVAEAAEAATGAGAPAAAVQEAATVPIDLKAGACIVAGGAYVTAIFSNAVHEGNCVDKGTNSSPQTCKQGEVWDDKLKQCYNMNYSGQK